jgi:hypothetical protein
MRLEQAAAGYRLTAQCSRRAAVCWTGAEAPILHLCDGVTAVAVRFCQRRLLGAATAAPRRFVARSGRAQLIGRSVGRTSMPAGGRDLILVLMVSSVEREYGCKKVYHQAVLGQLSPRFQ